MFYLQEKIGDEHVFAVSVSGSAIKSDLRKKIIVIVVIIVRNFYRRNLVPYCHGQVRKFCAALVERKIRFYLRARRDKNWELNERFCNAFAKKKKKNQIETKVAKR